MEILIIKLGATGDVVRTTSLLRVLQGEVTWVTSEKNRVFVDGVWPGLRTLAWEERQQAQDRTYDLVINLEDESDTAGFVRALKLKQLFGAYLDDSEHMAYTKDARPWFDLSLISRFGREQADRLKFKNRSSYQELLFRALGFEFRDQSYCLPRAVATGLRGDVAIALVAGTVWPMKRWAYYDALKRQLEGQGLVVNVLGTRSSMLEHLGDVQGHRCVVSGDTLPMHLALGSGVQCVSIFTCTSPWEIADYGLLTKVISPRLGEFFYQRGFDERATTAVGVEEVYEAVRGRLTTDEP